MATYSYKLLYNDAQERSLRHYAKASRFSFNRSLQAIRDREGSGKGVLLDILTKDVVRLGRDEEFNWLSHVPEAIIRGAVHDAYLSYLYYKSSNGAKKFPHFKVKDKSRLSFCLDSEDIIVVNNMSIRVDGIDGDISLDSPLEVCGFKKVRVRFENNSWVLTCESEV